jgi:phosphoenolpyruvate carboxylase
VSFKYLLPGLARRNLEAAVAGALLATFPERTARVPTDAERAVLEELARVSLEHYRALVWEEPSFIPFLRTFTPIDELALLALGSRPARRPDDEDYLPSLRAIPWVFAWTQNRVPAARVVRVRDGARVAADARAARALRRAAVLPLARRQPRDDAREVEPRGRARLPRARRRRLAVRAIASEHARTVDAVLAASGVGELLERQPVSAARSTCATRTSIR